MPAWRSGLNESEVLWIVRSNRGLAVSNTKYNRATMLFVEKLGLEEGDL